MINKEEIEEAKKTLYPLSIGDFITWFTTDGVVKVELSVQTLLQYIEQLEKEKEESYWQGYIKKQQESVEICKICKYRDKYRQLEAELFKANNTINQYKKREQKTIKYLEQEINVSRTQWITSDGYVKSETIKSKYVDRKLYAREILEMLKGEKKNGNEISNYRNRE